MDTSERRVRFHTFVKAEPGRVFDALATAEGLDGWFTRGASVDPRPGGEIVLRWKDWGPDGYTGEARGPVVAWDRPRRFSFRWKVDLGSYLTTVDVTFRPHHAPHLGEGTLVEVTEGVYEESAQGLEDMLLRAGGWAEALTLLKVFVEHGVRA